MSMELFLKSCLEAIKDKRSFGRQIQDIQKGYYPNRLYEYQAKKCGMVGVTVREAIRGYDKAQEIEYLEEEYL